MAWNLETAKQYLGIDPADTTQDANIQLTLDTVLESIEGKLGRGLLFRRETIEFFNTSDGTLILPRYPIGQVHATDPAYHEHDFKVQNRSGWIYSVVFAGQAVVTVDYEGGYLTLPYDLEWAMWEAFMWQWNRVDQTTGGPDQSAVIASGGSGDVKSFTVFDGFKVDYDVGAVSSSTDAADAAWGWLAPWAGTFNRYRNGFSGTGLGIA